MYIIHRICITVEELNQVGACLTLLCPTPADNAVQILKGLLVDELERGGGGRREPGKEREVVLKLWL